MKEITGKIIDKVIDKTYVTIEALCKIMLVIMVIVIAYTVFGRFVLKNSPTWGEEVGIFFLVWVAIISISLGIKDGRHIRMTLLEIFLPKKMSIALDKLGHLFIMLVALVMVIEGTKLTILSLNVKMPATGISSAWLYVCVPISGIVILIMLIGKVRDGKWL